MIAIDTNILVRLLVKDSPKQYAVANELMQKNSLYLPDSVLIETEWVLRSVYGYLPLQVCNAFRSVLGLKNITLNDPLKWGEILKWHESGMDFADAVHLGHCESVRDLKTFDRDFIDKAKGLTNCRVSAP